MGSGLGGTKGPLKPAMTQRLMNQFGQQFARDQMLVFLLMNQCLRNGAAAAVAARVKCLPAAFRDFHDALAEPTMEAQLQAAIDNPNTPGARQLIRRLSKFLSVAGANVPFGPAQRDRSMAHLHAMCRTMGLPSVFLTVSFSDESHPLAIRLGGVGDKDAQLPATAEGLLEKLRAEQKDYTPGALNRVELKKRLANNPVAAARVFMRLTDALLEHLLGIRPAHRTKLTRSRVGTGVFGAIRGYVAVIEAQRRGSLHLHLVAWTAMEPALLQRAANRPDTHQLITRILDSQFTHAVSADAHLADLLRSTTNHRLPPPSWRCQPAAATTAPGNDTCTSMATQLQIHEHAATCHKGKSGGYGCRLARPQPTWETHAPLMVSLREFTANDAAAIQGAVRVADASTARLVTLSTMPDDAAAVGISSSKPQYVMQHSIPPPTPSEASNPIGTPDQRCLYLQMPKPATPPEAWQATPPCTPHQGSLLQVQRTRLLQLRGLQVNEATAAKHKLVSEAMESRNGSFVETSASVLAAIRANVTATLLGCSEQAKTASMYLVKVSTSHPQSHHATCQPAHTLLDFCSISPSPRLKPKPALPLCITRFDTCASTRRKPKTPALPRGPHSTSPHDA